MIKQNKEGNRIIRELHEVILEEKEINPDMAFQIGRFIELENRRWILKHKNDLIDTGKNVLYTLDYLVACKLTEVRKSFNLDEPRVFEAMTNIIKAYYNNIKEDNNVSLSSYLNVHNKDKDYRINCCNNLENYIINLDSSYAEHLDERVDWFYVNYTEFKEKQSKNTDKASTAEKTKEINPKKYDTFIATEPKKVAPTPEKEEVDSIASWVHELGNYIVSENKLIKRK